MVDCEASSQQVVHGQCLQGPARPSDVHENVNIMSKVAWWLSVVIVCTCIIGCRFRNSMRMTHKEPTHLSQHEAQLQKSSSRQRKKMKKKMHMATQKSEREAGSWRTTFTEFTLQVLQPQVPDLDVMDNVVGRSSRQLEFTRSIGMDSVQLIPHWQDDVKTHKSVDNNPAKTTAPHASAVLYSPMFQSTN
jgi:hypothetical protein